MVFLELVPNDLNNIIEESKWALNTFDDIEGINVPDILRIKNRSYDIVQNLAAEAIPNIPHIRICDFSTNQLIRLCEQLLSKNVTNILLISGDPPPNPLQPIFKHNIVSIIKLISNRFPKLSIYAGHDPYRQSFKAEYEYSKQKIQAGAKGLFTQPIFNEHLSNMLFQLDLNCQWYIGISPVLSENSYNYWVSRNNVIFPSDFELTIDYNVRIGKKIIQISKDANQNNYIMPIKSNVKDYLGRLFDEN